MTPEDFERWREFFPEIWHRFCAIADEAWTMGRRRWSADAVAHIVRWSTGHEVNNYLTPYLARAYLAERPDRPSFFELRASQADGAEGSPQLELGL